MMNVDQKLKAITDEIGLEETLCQLAEECSELSQAVLKYRRSMKGTTPVSPDVARMKVIEETADVGVCIKALLPVIADNGLMGHLKSAEESKTERWYERTFGNPK